MLFCLLLWGVGCSLTPLIRSLILPTDLWLYAATAPSIESSHSLRLGCYGYAYDACVWRLITQSGRAALV